MLVRLTHAAIAFAVTALTYQAYVVAVVPFVEPPSVIKPRAAGANPAWSESRETPDRYHDLLAAYFPPDHWSLRQPPIAFDNGQILIVVDGAERYSQSDDGKLRASKCAVVYFPHARDRTAPPPRNAIVMEPSGGAMLQLDNRLDPAVSSFGRMQFGQLLGDITVRSDMRDPGPQDDLLVTTRDLYMNEDLIQTAEPVELRLGAHHGRGRGLEIRRLPAEASSPGADSSVFGQLDSLEITHEVSVVVAAGSLKSPAAAGDGSGNSAAAGSKLVDAPIRLQSAGPFHIDFHSRVASFVDQVQVRQLHPDGKLDELDADKLSLYFVEANRWNSDTSSSDDGVAPTSESPHDAPDLLAFDPPETIEASGSEQSPVHLKAQSHDAEAVGQRLYIELSDRRVTLEGGDEVKLNYRGAEVHAPMVTYQLPPENSPEHVGVLFARGGFGRLTAVPDPKRPDQVLDVTWKDSMQLVRDHGQPVLKLDGRPRVSMSNVGTLYADRLELFLHDDPKPTEMSTTAEMSMFPSTVRPDRLAASDHVVIQSAELNGKVNRLDLKFDYPQSGPGPSAAATNSGARVATGSAPPMGLRTRQAGGRAYDIAGVELKLNVAVRDRSPEVTRIRVNGAVAFQEMAGPAGGDSPLRITAERLEVTDADTPNATIDIRGAGGQDGLPFHPAEIASRGAIISAPQLTVNRGTSQAWIKSPGEVQMTMDRDVSGAPLAQPMPISITWQESMQLEGDLITFVGDVRVKNADGWLRTRRLMAKLTAPVRFDGVGGQAPPKLAEVRCDDGAIAEFDQHDETGAVVAHQHVELQWLQANQLTGEITGSGPGRVDSIHFSRGAGQLLGGATTANLAAAPNASSSDGPPQLRHLSVDFLREVAGNLNTPRISVAGDVKTVYGPIGSWDQRLTMTSGGRPAKDTFWITCERLQVARSPMSGVVVAADGTRKSLNQVELQAQGLPGRPLVIEGEDPNGAFTIRGDKASYDQPKTQFILEGEEQGQAVITHQQSPGAPPQDQSAHKFFYYQNTGEARAEGLSKIQWQTFDQGKKPAATETR